MANYVSKLLQVAQAQVGYLEKETNKNLDSKTANAGDENRTKYARDFDTKYPNFYNGKKQGAEWCDIFVDWCFVEAFGEEEAQRLLGQPDKSCGAGCGWSADYFKKIGRFSNKPIVGAQIFFKDSDGDVCHTGIVKKVGSKYVYTIEGNTSKASGVIANGGGVAEKQYALNYSRIYGYGIPKFDVESIPSKNDGATAQSSSVKNEKFNAKVCEWQKAAIADGFEFPEYGADGEWGAECRAVANNAIIKVRDEYWYPELTKFLQKELGFTGSDVDGKCGAQTRSAIRKYQYAHGLSVDGKCGINTWRSILGV
jgi:hypothetical protein